MALCGMIRLHVTSVMVVVCISILSYVREVSALLFYDTGQCEILERCEGQKYRLSRFFIL